MRPVRLSRGFSAVGDHETFFPILYCIRICGVSEGIDRSSINIPSLWKHILLRFHGLVRMWYESLHLTTLTHSLLSTHFTARFSTNAINPSRILSPACRSFQIPFSIFFMPSSTPSPSNGILSPDLFTMMESGL